MRRVQSRISGARARGRCAAVAIGCAAFVCSVGVAASTATSAARAAVTVWAVGDGPNANPATRPKEVTNFLKEQEPFNDLLWLGDIYKARTDTVFNDLYGPTYGQFAKKTFPTPGNHELSADTPLGPYDHYWEQHRPFVVGPKKDGKRINLYTTNLGDGWRLLGLTSSFPLADSPGVAPTPPHPSVQDVLNFLHNELSAHTGTCYIAIMHRPRYSAGGRASQNTDLQPIWQELAGRVDLYVQGHEHEYFRLDPSKIPDYFPTTVSHDNHINGDLVPGAQSFVVGTGGITLDWLDQPNQIFDIHFPGLERYLVAPTKAHNLDLNYYGALRLSLTEGKASYEYVKLNGSVYDSGTTTCKPVAPVPRAAARRPARPTRRRPQGR